MYISVDMGGTKTRVALSQDLKTLQKVKRFYTNKNPSTQKQIISSGIKDLLAGKELTFACYGVPGTMDRDTKTFITLPNYKDLNNKSFSSLIDEEFLDRSVVENDAVLGAVGEAFFGAGREHNNIGYLTFGTGVGGAMVIKKDNGAFEYIADEPGHTTIVEGGRVNSSCKHSGCLEAYTSGRSFEALFGIKPQYCSDDKIWKKYAEFVNKGFKVIHDKWQCEVFIYGGSMALEYDIFGKYLQAPVPVLRSLTLDDAGVYGGLSLIKKHLDS